jgi:hypothetical protein
MLLRDADLSRMPREARLEFFALFLPTKPSRVVINKKKVPAEIVRMRIAAWIYRYRLAHGKYDEAIEAAAAHHKIKWTRARDIWTELGGIAAVFVHTMNGEAVPKDDPSLEKSLQRYVTRIRSGRKK